MRIYLDHNATTPLHDEVVEAMIPVLREDFGNPSSIHAEGAAARAAVERAREQVAALLGCEPDEVYFTAGATEANNAVLRGLAEGRARAQHVVTSTIEHPSVAEPLAALEEAGWRVTRVAVDADGLLDPAAVGRAIEADTALVSIIWANNETGAIQPIAEIGREVAARGVPLHVDATQAVGKLPIDLRRLAIDWLSCSAHKLNGPKGTGCLVARGERGPIALLRGGPQERGRRGGTENVAGIVGFGAACRAARRELPRRVERNRALRDRLWEGIASKVPRVRLNGAMAHLLPNTLNVELEGVAGEVLLQALDLEGVAVSMGAACHSGSVSPSHVLTAMGRTPGQARSSLRFSVGQGVDEAQIDRVLSLLGDLVERAREAGAP